MCILWYIQHMLFDLSDLCGSLEEKQRVFLVESAVALQPAWTCDQRKCNTEGNWRQIVTERNHQIQLRPLPILILILLVMLTTLCWILAGRLNPFSTLPCYGIEYWPKDAKLIQVHNFQLRLVPEISRLGSTWILEIHVFVKIAFFEEFFGASWIVTSRKIRVQHAKSSLVSMNFGIAMNWVCPNMWYKIGV